MFKLGRLPGRQRNTLVVGAGLVYLKKGQDERGRGQVDEAVADWNPVSAVAAGARQLWGNPNPSAAIHAWPMQHPVEAGLIWSVLILAIAAPLASHFYRRRTTE